jgi:protein SCO1/2
MRHLVMSAALVALTLGCSTAERGSAEPGAASGAAADLPILPIGGDFTLTDQDGRPFLISSLKGKVVLVFFGYTMCPDACPTTLSKLSSAYARLTDAERSRVKAVYISIDPERDTPDVLSAHLTYFGVDAVGLTGGVEETAKVAARFGAHFEKSTETTAAGYLMSHTVSVFGLDAEGRTRLLIDYDASVDQVVKDIRALLAAS